MKLTYAFCTYNRANRLATLVAAMRAQACPLPFEILAVNNNSQDATLDILAELARGPGAPLRYVTETAQGIVPARNRAIAESLDSDILVFIDDDEMPCDSMLAAVCDAILEEGAECVGGRIGVDFEQHGRPAWLDDELTGFLGALDYGPAPFWIENDSTPIWSGNIAYRTTLFKTEPPLRFDRRFNREGAEMGGGEDVQMFRTLLANGARTRYRPDMAIRHFVEPARLRWRYFLKLHYTAGLRQGLHQLPAYPRAFLGVPPFMVSQFLAHCFKYLSSRLKGRSGTLRQGMNAMHALGAIIGLYRRRVMARHKPAGNT